VRNTKLTKFNRLRKLFLSENRISEHEHGEDKFSTRRQPMSSTASDTSTITQVDEFQLQNFMVNHATMPVVEIMDPFILEKLMEYSTISPYPVSIAELLENGNKEIYSEEQSYKFLKKQVAVRLAHMVMELQHLPKELHAEKKCRSTMEKYCQSFDEIIQFEKKDPTPVVLKDFMEFLFKFKDRHHQVTAHCMAEACVSMKEKLNISVDDVHNPIFISINTFLDRLYTNKIGIRMISDQHLYVYGYERVRPNNVGIIKPNCNLTSVLVDALDDATFEIESIYGAAPKVDIQVVHNDKSQSCKLLERCIPPQGHLVPSHLFLIFNEILKNAMRATVEYHPDSKDDLPAISAIVCQAEENDFTIKISDYGGGMDRESIARCFLYQYTTKPSIPNNNLLGYGLPLARLYARYFDGDLRLTSYQGYGTDVYIYIRALASSARERIPVYNRESSLDSWSWFDDDRSSDQGPILMHLDGDILVPSAHGASPVKAPLPPQKWNMSIIEEK